MSECATCIARQPQMRRWLICLFGELLSGSPPVLSSRLSQWALPRLALSQGPLMSLRLKFPECSHPLFPFRFLIDTVVMKTLNFRADIETRDSTANSFVKYHSRALSVHLCSRAIAIVVQVVEPKAANNTDCRPKWRAITGHQSSLKQLASREATISFIEGINFYSSPLT